MLATKDGSVQSCDMTVVPNRRMTPIPSSNKWVISYGAEMILGGHLAFKFILGHPSAFGRLSLCRPYAHLSYFLEMVLSIPALLIVAQSMGVHGCSTLRRTDSLIERLRNKDTTAFFSYAYSGFKHAPRQMFGFWVRAMASGLMLRTAGFSE